jgi:hypothetical protein
MGRWRIIHRQRSVLLANSNTRFRLSTQQLLDFFECNEKILRFHAEYTPFCYESANICVRSVLLYGGSAKLLALQTKNGLVYVPLRIAFRLLHFRKMHRNNVLILVDMQLGIKQKPLAM